MLEANQFLSPIDLSFFRIKICSLSASIYGILSMLLILLAQLRNQTPPCPNIYSTTTTIERSLPQQNLNLEVLIYPLNQYIELEGNKIP